MAKSEIGIFLTQQGFFAGKKNQDGTLQLGAKKITEDEIFAMFSALMRTWKAKVGEDTLVIPGNDGHMVVAKLVEIKADAPAEEQAAVSELPKKKRTKKAAQAKAKKAAPSKAK